MSIVPCMTWVRRGVANANPKQLKVEVNELNRITTAIEYELEDVKGLQNVSDAELEEANSGTSRSAQKINTEPEDGSNDNDEFDFDKYDDEPDVVYCATDNIVNYENDTNHQATESNDEDSEEEDDIIKSDDNLLLLGHVEKDAGILEVYVYNEREGSLYCHHEILLHSFPLCIEWLSYDPAQSKPANLCAIGNMTPEIEVWDLDLIDCLETSYTLGTQDGDKEELTGHKDAVLDISWNQNYKHILASGSVDQTVLLWDLENQTAVTKIDSFKEKVQSLKWHPTESHALLTGCADKTVKLFDCKQENIMKRWKVSGEVERVIWNHYDTNYCVASTNNGYILYIDVRKDKPVWQISAHEKEITGLSFSSSCPSLLVSSSNDGVVKAWDMVNNEEPCCIWVQNHKVGAIQCLEANPDSAFVFSVGGDKKSNYFQVIDMSEILTIRDRFIDKKTETSVSHVFGTKEGKKGMTDVTKDMKTLKLAKVPSETRTKKKKNNKS